MMREADSALKKLCEEKNGQDKNRGRERGRECNGVTANESVSPQRSNGNFQSQLSELSQLNDVTSAMVPAASDWDTMGDGVGGSGRGGSGGLGDHADWNYTGVDTTRGAGGGGEWGDTGSVLTHGSSVVLAGNMAAAMRQRKRQTQHYSTMKHEEGEDGLSSTPSTQTNNTALNSRSSSVTDRGKRFVIILYYCFLPLELITLSFKFPAFLLSILFYFSPLSK